MTDELDAYSKLGDEEEAVVTELSDEHQLADAEELIDVAAEGDETPFDETRHEYSGVREGDGDVDVEEYEEAGALFDDPEKIVLLEGGIDDPDGSDSWT